jgi:hypothetical protein
VTTSARRDPDTPLAQPNEWGPHGFRRFLILMLVSGVLAAPLIWLIATRG